MIIFTVQPGYAMARLNAPGIRLFVSQGFFDH